MLLELSNFTSFSNPKVILLALLQVLCSQYTTQGISVSGFTIFSVFLLNRAGEIRDTSLIS